MKKLQISVENCGQDLQLKLTNEYVQLVNGPFSYEYQIDFMQLKFGSSSFQGSDHQINGQSFPGEVNEYHT